MFVFLLKVELVHVVLCVDLSLIENGNMENRTYRSGAINALTPADFLFIHFVH